MEFSTEGTTAGFTIIGSFHRTIRPFYFFSIQTHLCLQILDDYCSATYGITMKPENRSHLFRLTTYPNEQQLAVTFDARRGRLLAAAGWMCVWSSLIPHVTTTTAAHARGSLAQMISFSSAAHTCCSSIIYLSARLPPQQFSPSS